uniref:RHS repeat domain-containing protein n=1 Tax=Photobacterium marinum TaxID=1056511 RepID=UPI000A0591EC
MWDGEQLIGEHCNGEYTWYLYEPVTLIKQGQIYHYHLVHLGTPLKLTDRSGAVVWDAQYQTFGAVTLNVETFSNPLRFQGQYFDQETCLHYNRFCYYDPDSGRFIHQDPIGLSCKDGEGKPSTLKVVHYGLSKTCYWYPLHRNHSSPLMPSLWAV